MDLKEALKTLESRQWCSMRVITANLKKGIAGKVLELPKCRLATRQSDRAIASISGITRNTHQNQNFTRNIELANSQRILTIHPILITHLNNQALV